MQFDYLETYDGRRIRFGSEPGGGSSKDPLLVLLNGRSEFMEKYLPVTEKLRQRGFRILSMDWYGQGLSQRPLEDRHKGYVFDFKDYLSDLDLFFHQVVCPLGHPVTLLAHSMGGHLALRFLMHGSRWVERAILVSPMVDIHTFPFPRSVAEWLSRAAVAAGAGRRYASANGSYDPRKVCFRGNPLTHDPRWFRLEHDWIARNPDLALGGVTWQWLKAAFDSIALLKRAGTMERVTTRVKVFSAQQDRVVSNRAQQALCRRMPGCEMITVPGARHEILHETDTVQEMFWQAFDTFTGIPPRV